MILFRNRSGKLYVTGIHGTYPVNDGDPQNDVDDEEIPEEPDFTDEMADAEDRRIDLDNERY